ncbi:hypothetical protein M0812_06024 [Anaeramoeba flamelloides]|uniref:Uncharacterized protein n=1 Tax=Anaeramoeba flamelloides TaxID=1746091 RepID=A0AAV8A6J4_9EUKA|nr:hypothetical protein M0812_06024 [Anaeramoeba flamelloides]
MNKELKKLEKEIDNKNLNQQLKTTVENVETLITNLGSYEEGVPSVILRNQYLKEKKKRLEEEIEALEVLISDLNETEIEQSIESLEKQLESRQERATKEIQRLNISQLNLSSQETGLYLLKPEKAIQEFNEQFENVFEYFFESEEEENIIDLKSYLYKIPIKCFVVVKQFLAQFEDWFFQLMHMQKITTSSLVNKFLERIKHQHFTKILNEQAKKENLTKVLQYFQELKNLNKSATQILDDYVHMVCKFFCKMLIVDPSIKLLEHNNETQFSDSLHEKINDFKSGKLVILFPGLVSKKCQYAKIKTILL